MAPTYNLPGIRPFLAIKLFCSLAKHIRILTLSWLIFEITKSPLALGFIGLAEAIPYIISILWAGQYVDRKEKSRVLRNSNIGCCCCSIAFTLLISAEAPSTLALYGVIGCLGLATSYYTVSASAYLQGLVSKEHFSQVYASSVGLYQTGVIVGPIAAGCIIAWKGAVASMSLVIGLELIAIYLVRYLPKHPPAPSALISSGVENIRVGLKYIKAKKTIWAPMLLDMIAVLFGDVVAILPIFAVLLGVGSEGLGVLRAGPAIGGILVTVTQSIYPCVPISWKALLRTVTFFGICMICFALSSNFYLSLLFLILSGIADSISVIIRQSTYQAHTPHELRGRIASVNGIFIRSSNEIGAFESGLAAQLLGTIPSVLFGGIIAIGVVGVMQWKIPSLESDTPR